MTQQQWKKGLLPLCAAFIGIPILLYATGEAPKRTLLKESISLLTLLSFSLMIAQFFLTRCNRRLIQDFTMAGIIRLHKAIGYVFITALLAHPFLIVLPRYFEAGADPKDAFITIISTVSSPGIVTGMAAWMLILLLAVTSLLRKRLFSRYTTWRTVHGILSAVFLICASYHAVNLGRHATPMMSACIITGTVISLLLLGRTHIPAKKASAVQEAIA